MGFIANMKPVQVTFDEALLERLDRHPAVRERGRSAVLREAAVEYLKRQDAEEISRRYRAGYRDTSALDDEIGGWAAEIHRTTSPPDSSNEEHRE